MNKLIRAANARMNVYNDTSAPVNELLLEEGQIIEAEVIEKNNNSLTLKKTSNIPEDGMVFHADTAEVSAEPGEILKFVVVKKENKNLVLKQIKNREHEKEAIKEPSQHAAVIINGEILSVKKSHVNEHTKVSKEISYTINNVSSETVAELSRNGFKKEKITIGTLNLVSKETDTAPDVTEKSEAIIKNVIKKYESLKQLDEKTISHILKSDKPLTVENIYISKYSLGRTTAQPAVHNISTDVWKKLEPQIKKIMEREEIQVTKDTLELSKFLIKNDIPVTKENIEKTIMLNNIGKYATGEEIIHKAVKNIKKGLPPADVLIFENHSLMNEVKESYEKTVEAVNHITDEAVKITISRKEPVTIQNLHSNSTEKAEPKEYPRNIEIEAVTCRRRLAEIQLKLTHEAYTRLAGKGIDINTLPLERAVESLKELEAEDYAKSLRIMQAEPTQENIKMMSSIYEKVNLMTPVSFIAYNNIITNKEEFTIETVSESNRLAISRFLSDAETFATQPSRKYGDSYSQAVGQMPALLESLDIPATEPNVRAAVILSKNEIDVNAENITEVKIIDQKVNQIKQKLHPNIAANMVKENFNPINMHIDEVISYIDKFNDVYGENISDKVSEYIMQMDERKELAPEDRETMIAVYRLLNMVNKNSGVAIGVALKNETELTLGNLLEASKYYKRTAGRQEDFNYTIDDNFGILDKLIMPENNIRHIFQNRTTEIQSILQNQADSTSNLRDAAYRDIGLEAAALEESFSLQETETNEAVISLIREGKEPEKLNLSELTEHIKNYKPNTIDARTSTPNARDIKKAAEIITKLSAALEYVADRDIHLESITLEDAFTLQEENAKEAVISLIREGKEPEKLNLSELTEHIKKYKPDTAKAETSTPNPRDIKKAAEIISKLSSAMEYAADKDINLESVTLEDAFSLQETETKEAVISLIREGKEPEKLNISELTEYIKNYKPDTAKAETSPPNPRDIKKAAEIILKLSSLIEYTADKDIDNETITLEDAFTLQETEANEAVISLIREGKEPEKLNLSELTEHIKKYKPDTAKAETSTPNPRDIKKAAEIISKLSSSIEYAADRDIDNETITLEDAFSLQETEANEAVISLIREGKEPEKLSLRELTKQIKNYRQDTAKAETSKPNPRDIKKAAEIISKLSSVQEYAADKSLDLDAIALEDAFSFKKTEENEAVASLIRDGKEPEKLNLRELTEYIKNYIPDISEINTSATNIIDAAKAEEVVTKLLSALEYTADENINLETITLEDVVSKLAVSNTEMRLTLTGEDKTNKARPIRVTAAVAQLINNGVDAGELTVPMLAKHINDYIPARNPRRITSTQQAKADEVIEKALNVLAYAEENDIPLETATINELAEKSEKSQTLAGKTESDYKNVLSHLSNDEKEAVKKILKENNMGATARNAETAAEIVRFVSTVFNINNGAVKQIIYNTALMDEITEEAYPEQLKAFIKDIPQGISLEEMLSRLKELPRINYINETQTIKYLEQLKQLNEQPNATAWLEKNNVPLTINNIIAMQGLVKDSFFFGNQLSKLKDSKKASNDKENASEETEDTISPVLDEIMNVDLEDFKNGGDPNQNLDDLYKRLERAKDSETHREVIEQIKMIQNAILIQKNNNCLKVPLKINQKYTDLNVYVINEINTHDDVKTFISLETEKLGTVQIYFKQNEGKISLSINSDIIQASEYLEQNAPTLQKLLLDSGHEITDLSFGKEAVRNPLMEELGKPFYKTENRENREAVFYDVVSKILKYVEITDCNQ